MTAFLVAEYALFFECPSSPVVLASVTHHPQLCPHTIQQSREICARDELPLLITQLCKIVNTEVLV